MPSFIDDGYIRDGYIRPPEEDRKTETLFDPLTFSYRQAMRVENLTHDAEIRELSLQKDTAENAIAIETKACEFAAAHLKSWDLKNRGGHTVEPTAKNLMQIHQGLFTRLYNVIRGTQTNDPKPNSKPTLSDEDMVKNSEAVSGLPSDTQK